MIKVMITSHRPHRLGGYDENNPIMTFVKKQTKNILEKLKATDDIIGISGMAIGGDQIFCKVCLELNIPYIAYLPFAGQELKWSTAAQKQYKELISKAKQVIIVSPGNYSPRKMQLRNEAMAKDCDISIGVWDGKTYGGTYNCIKYLKSIGKKIIHINPNDYKNDC